MTNSTKLILTGLLIAMIFTTACNRKKKCEFPYQAANIELKETPLRPGGGSSGMVQIDENKYLTVYDLKRFEEGPRMGFITLTAESLCVESLTITGWGETGISSDLESICAIPGRNNEFLVAESGAWQENTGRIFHVTVDTANISASVNGHFKIPLLNNNDIGLVGDQYEAILSLPYNETKVLVLLGERGGSQVNPKGLIRWGVADLESYTFIMEGPGLKGIPVNAPGKWTQESHRHITDFYVDDEGFLWTAGCEDIGDLGPFYSVIYKIGIINKNNHEIPVNTSIDCLTYRNIDGFKIEALSGPPANINATHCFGTEDENYGGVWRPILINDR